MKQQSTIEYAILNSVTSLRKAVVNKSIYVEVGDVFVNVTKVALIKAAKHCRSFVTFTDTKQPHFIWIEKMNF